MKELVLAEEVVDIVEDILVGPGCFTVEMIRVV